MAYSTISSSSSSYGGASINGGYWSQFPNFEYNPNAGFRSNYKRLANQQNWSEKQRKRHQEEALKSAFDYFYGTDDKDVTAWQSLCSDVGIKETPRSITKAKRALGKVLVNLVNLIDHKSVGLPLMKFRNFDHFRKYTMNGRTCRLDEAKDNGIVKALLRKVR